MPDREKVIRLIEEEISVCESVNQCYRTIDLPALRDILALLKEQEAVVRCKDCKYAYLTDDGECKYCEMEKDDNGFLIERYSSWDWFCADGERKEGR